jgi:hypothetical protein
LKDGWERKSFFFVFLKGVVQKIHVITLSEGSRLTGFTMKIPRGGQRAVACLAAFVCIALGGYKRALRHNALVVTLLTHPVRNIHL